MVKLQLRNKKSCHTNDEQDFCYLYPRYTISKRI